MIDNSKIIYCYNGITGEFINQYNSKAEASNVLKIDSSSISRSVKLGYRALGFYFSKIKYNNYISEYLNINKPKIIIHTKESEQNNKSKQNPTIQKLIDRYTDDELKAIAEGHMTYPGAAKFPVLDFDGEHVKIGLMGDTHLGSSYTNEKYIYQAFEIFGNENVDFMAHTGDVTEGMSNRPGHIYELSSVGYAKQKEYAINVLSQCPVPAYYIDGNHDRWYIKGSGAIIVQDICDAIPNATFLGHDQGDIIINGVTLQLWHGEDGNSYATSYRIQKIVESFSGGNKPNALFLGHTHKQAYIFERNIHCVSAGSMQAQTPWMRGKRIAAHTGFSIVDLYIGKKGITRFKIEWFPFYV